MKKNRVIAQGLHFLSLALAGAYLLTTAYSIICLCTGWQLTYYGGNSFVHINYPFTSRPFLNIDNNISYILFSFLLPMLLYGLFFWLSANVFFVFATKKLFTLHNLKQLKRFWIFNLFIPGPLAILSSFFGEGESNIWVLVAVHAILGLFTYFLAAIFRQGLQLQNEQDLFI